MLLVFIFVAFFVILHRSAVASTARLIYFSRAAGESRIVRGKKAIHAPNTYP